MGDNRKWTANDIPDLTGKTAVVTGANSGLGFETALELANHGATVVLACRNLEKGDVALGRIADASPKGTASLSELDLANLASVRAFTERFRSAHDSLDILCNNAGIMAVPHRKTADGFEMQLGTNHFGHYALTGMLIEPLLAAPRARIVSVSSLMHKVGKMHFDDLTADRSYNKWVAYAQSKLANLLFAYALQHRLEAKGQRAISVAAHPGYSSTNLQLAAPEMAGSGFGTALWKTLQTPAQSPKMGALPTLRAATDPDVQGGDYFGPSGFMEIVGYPKKVTSTKRSHDRDAQRRLWDMSAELTSVRYL